RRDRNWSQEELARRAGVSQQLITKLERGEARESRKIANIAAAFGLSVEQLLHSAGAMQVRQMSPRWPFDIEYHRYAGLPERERIKIEGIIEQAVKDHERSLANASL